MSSISFSPIAIFPEYLKGGGGHNSNDNDDDDETPSGDVTLVVSIVETYDDASYSEYETFLDDLRVVDWRYLFVWGVWELFWRVNLWRLVICLVFLDRWSVL